jgi:hypothetical protein
MQNYIKQFVENKYMYPAARAYRSDVYEHHKANFAAIGGVSSWLKEYHSLLWYRSDFNSSIKCDYITNNIVGMFNNWMKDYKDLPVCQLVDKLRVMIMELFFRRRRIGERFTRKILPFILTILRVRTRGLGHLSLVKGDYYSAEV